MATFAQIQAHIREVMDIPEEELTEEQQAAMAEYLEALGEAEAEKIDGFGQFIQLETARMEAVKEEARRLAQKARTIESRIMSLKSHYMYTMTTNGLKKVKGNAYTVSVRESTAVEAPTSENALRDIQRVNPGLVREKVEFSPDKKAIGEALKAGEYIPGCRLVTNRSLQIR